MFGFNIFVCHLFGFSFLLEFHPLFAYLIIFSFIYAFIKLRFQNDSIKNDSVITPICNFEHPIDCDEIEEEKIEIYSSIEILRLVKEEEKEI